MKTFTHLLCVLILSIVLFACNNVHFLKEESYRNQVAQDFEQKKQALPHGDLFAIFADSILSVYECEALMFLYAYMPIGDVTDYPGDYYLENVRLSKQTRDEMPWGKEIPDEVFRHFVLPIRVNNENLDDSEKYTADDMIGKAGLESEFESYLRGKDGYQKMYVDNLGKVIEVIDSQDSVAGNDIYLTIDSDLQKYCYNALEKEITSILLAHIKNVTTSNDKDDIPITDVYFALFDNNIISIDDLAAKDATDLERSVNDTFQSSKSYTLGRLDDILNSSHIPLYNLTDQYQDYMEFICEQLSDAGIYSPGKISKTDDTYVSYINNNISLCGLFRWQWRPRKSSGC